MNKFGPTLSAAQTAIFHRASGPETNNSWTKKPRVVKSPPPMSPALRVRKCFVLAGLLWAFPALIFGQTNGLQGGDLSLTGGLNGDQVFPAAAFGTTGGFYLWHDAITDPFGLGVSVQRLNASLAPEGPVLPVNQTLPLDQSRPKAAMFADGGAVFAWQSGRSGLQNVFARVISSTGSFVGNEVLMNNPALKVKNRYTAQWTLYRGNKPYTKLQTINEKISVRQDFNANASVCVLADGSAVVTWSSSRVYETNTIQLQHWQTFKETGDGGFTILNHTKKVPVRIRVSGMQDVYAQRISAAGTKLGGEFRLNIFSEFNQRDASVAALSGGGFVAAWVSERQRGTLPNIFARVFDAAGNGGAEFCVSTNATTPSGSPTVTGTTGGGFTVAWVQNAFERTNGMEIFARAFDAAGSGLSAPFPVNTYTYGDQFSPSIASLGTQQLLVWSSMGQDGSWEGVFAQALNGATKIGDEFRVNVARAYSQKLPHVSSDGAGRALILWSGYGPGGSGFDVFGRTYVAP